MKNENFIKFLGTAGARFVMIKQLRSSGGIWIRFKSTDIIIDPGPGSLVRCNASRPKLDPSSLDGIILTHKHLDHSGDINVMIEAMTEGGFKKRGVVFLPSDAQGEEGVIFSYLKGFPEKILVLKKGDFSVGEINFSVPAQNLHSVITYGLKFHLGNEVVSFVSDTRYFEGLKDLYRDSTLLVINVVFHNPREQFEHFCLDDALKLIKSIKPKKAILTHFGMTLLKAKPHLLEKKVNESSGVEIKFAYDGLTQQI